MISESLKLHRRKMDERRSQRTGKTKSVYGRTVYQMTNGLYECDEGRIYWLSEFWPGGCDRDKADTWAKYQSYDVVSDRIAIRPPFDASKIVKRGELVEGNFRHAEFEI